MVAQPCAIASREGVDMSPLPSYMDSPVFIRDRVSDGYVRTCGTAVG